MKNISIATYGTYINDNYGTHTLKLTLGTVTLYYSYHIIIAFFTPEMGLVQRDNDLARGKHLNMIRKSRIQICSDEKFEKLLSEVLATVKFEKGGE